MTKSYPEEKVTVFFYRNNKPSAIEYLDMTGEMNRLLDKNGNLLYRDAHIMLNLFIIKVLKDIANKNSKYN